MAASPDAIRVALLVAIGFAGGCSSPIRREQADSGATLFSKVFTPADGLGPLYNGRSCAECHANPSPGGVATDGLAVVFRVGLLDSTGFDSLEGRGGPVARAHSVNELGYPCGLAPGVAAHANVVSTRNTPPLYGLGQIADIPDDVIVNGTAPTAGIEGRPNWIVQDGERHVGRFGWKAQVASLERFVADAVRTELGITNAVFPSDLVKADQAHGCAGFSEQPEADAELVKSLHAFIADLPAPQHRAECDERGREVFTSVGCPACHTPSLPAINDDVPLYSDLLLHDMGPALADGFVQEGAGASEWRTTPLWGLHLREHYLHDGRASTLNEALAAHDGEAAATMRLLNDLSVEERASLLTFLGCL